MHFLRSVNNSFHKVCQGQQIRLQTEQVLRLVYPIERGQEGILLSWALLIITSVVTNISYLWQINGIIFVLVLRAMLTSHKMMGASDRNKIK